VRMTTFGGMSKTAKVQVTLDIEIPAYMLRGRYVPDIDTQDEDYIKYMVLDVLNTDDDMWCSVKVKEYKELEVEEEED